MKLINTRLVRLLKPSCNITIRVSRSANEDPVGRTGEGVKHWTCRTGSSRPHQGLLTPAPTYPYSS